MKGQKFLKVTSILMIICGVIGAIGGVIAILGISALAAFMDSTEGTGLLYASALILTLASVIEFIAGIKGVGACNASHKAAASDRQRVPSPRVRQRRAVPKWCGLQGRAAALPR